MPSMPTGNKQLQMAGLESLGNNDRGDNVTLNATSQTLIKMAQDILFNYEANLRRSGRVSTGQSISLSKISDLEINGSVLSIDVLIPEYALYQDQGVNGTEVKHGSKYSFGSKMPPLAPLLKWARRRASRVVKYSPVSKMEKKDKRIKKMVSEADNYRSLAFAIAKSIQKKGIKPSKDFTRAVEKTANKFKKELANGFKIDIIESLK